MTLEKQPQSLFADIEYWKILQAVSNLLNNEKSADIDRMRLVMLYALRFERESPHSVEQLISRLAAKTDKHKARVWKTIS